MGVEVVGKGWKKWAFTPAPVWNVEIVGVLSVDDAIGLVNRRIGSSPSLYGLSF